MSRRVAPLRRFSALLLAGVLLLATTLVAAHTHGDDGGWSPVCATCRLAAGPPALVEPTVAAVAGLEARPVASGDDAPRRPAVPPDRPGGRGPPPCARPVA